MESNRRPIDVIVQSFSSIRGSEETTGKTPIDIKRDSQVWSSIGKEEDGEIIEMFVFDDKMLIIKTKSIYEFMLADKIDPKRENPELPTNIQKRILNLGSESELVSRTFLMAQKLFKQLPKSIDVTKALKLMLECLQELEVLELQIKEFDTCEEEALQEHEKRKEQKLPFAIPSIYNIETRCKTIFQKLNHASQSLMEIVLLFYSNAGLNKQSHFSKFKEFLLKEYGEEDYFFKFLDKALPFLQMVRNTRDCLDHRNAKDLKLTDFVLQADGSIIVPTFEINFRETKQEPIPLSILLHDNFLSIVNVVELMIVYLCDRHVEPGLMQWQVRFIPEERRLKNKLINYAYWSPIGENGFFAP